MTLGSCSFASTPRTLTPAVTTCCEDAEAPPKRWLEDSFQHRSLSLFIIGITSPLPPFIPGEGETSWVRGNVGRLPALAVVTSEVAARTVNVVSVHVLSCADRRLAAAYKPPHPLSLPLSASLTASSLQHLLSKPTKRRDNNDGILRVECAFECAQPLVLCDPGCMGAGNPAALLCCCAVQGPVQERAPAPAAARPAGQEDQDCQRSQDHPRRKRPAQRNLGLFAAAVVAGNVAKVPNSELNTLTAFYLASRVVFNLLYIFVTRETTASLRSASYLAGLGTIFTLFIKAGLRAVGELDGRDSFCDGVAEFLCGSVTPHVWSEDARVRSAKHRVDGPEHSCCRLVLAEMEQHHLACPDHADGNVDVELLRLDVRILLGHEFEARIPVGHGDLDAVRLGCTGELLPLCCLCQFESILEDPVYTDAGHDGFLNHRLAVRALEDLSAHLRQRTPQRHVVRVAVRIADRAKEDGVERLQELDPVVRHHLAVLVEVVARGKVERRQLEREAEALRCRLQGLQATWHDLLADSIARDDRNLV
ncbi:hypothetical protein L1887_56956 [Cichorium endivia]|nr:hypothetical protein L1887_56956 [Cichorium endivia]